VLCAHGAQKRVRLQYKSDRASVLLRRIALLLSSQSRLPKSLAMSAALPEGAVSRRRPEWESVPAQAESAFFLPLVLIAVSHQAFDQDSISAICFVPNVLMEVTFTVAGNRTPFDPPCLGRTGRASASVCMGLRFATAAGFGQMGIGTF